MHVLYPDIIRAYSCVEDIYIYIYIYIHIYIYIYIYTYIYTHTPTHTHTHTHTHTRIHTLIHTHIRTCTYQTGAACVRHGHCGVRDAHRLLDLFGQHQVCVCACVYMYIYYVSMRVCTCACACGFEHVCTYVCMTRTYSLVPT